MTRVRIVFIAALFIVPVFAWFYWTAKPADDLGGVIAESANSEIPPQTVSSLATPKDALQKPLEVSVERVDSSTSASNSVSKTVVEKTPQVNPEVATSGLTGVELAKRKWNEAFVDMQSLQASGRASEVPEVIENNLDSLIEIVGGEKAEVFLARRARAFEKAGDYEEELLAWEMFLEFFPGGVRAAEAHYRVYYCLKSLREPLEVQVDELDQAVSVGEDTIWGLRSLHALAKISYFNPVFGDALSIYTRILNHSYIQQYKKVEQVRKRAFFVAKKAISDSDDSDAALLIFRDIVKQFPGTDEAIAAEELLDELATQRI